MRITDKLMGYLHAAFHRSAEDERVWRARPKVGEMEWKIDDGFLTFTPQSTRIETRIDLRVHTLNSLIRALAAKNIIVSQIKSGIVQLSAMALMDGENNTVNSNGDYFFIQENVAWSYLDAASIELVAAQKQIGEMLKQMSVPTASEVWLDEIGRYYGVSRRIEFANLVEDDPTYAARILWEVLRPRSNNVAIQMAIKAISGVNCQVIDTARKICELTITDDSNRYNGRIFHDGREFRHLGDRCSSMNRDQDTSWANHYNGIIRHNGAHDRDINILFTGYPTHGLFDVIAEDDPEARDKMLSNITYIIELVNRLRAAGTHLNSMAFRFDMDEEDIEAPVDSMTLNFSDCRVHNGVFNRNGAIRYTPIIAGASVTI